MLFQFPKAPGGGGGTRLINCVEHSAVGCCLAFGGGQETAYSITQLGYQSFLQNADCCLKTRFIIAARGNQNSEDADDII